MFNPVLQDCNIDTYLCLCGDLVEYEISLRRLILVISRHNKSLILKNLNYASLNALNYLLVFLVSVLMTR